MTADDSHSYRLRFSFAVQGPLRYISVLDMGRLWERLLRRSALPLAYSQGFNPHPRLLFADALPVGYESFCEIVDVYLTHEVDSAQALEQVRAQSPIGLVVQRAAYVPLDAVKPQARMRAATYRVQIWSAATAEAFQGAITELLGKESLTRTRMRRNEPLVYDLRPLIHSVSYLQNDETGHTLEMRLRCGSHGSGRPEEVVAALALPVEQLSICRTELIWDEEE